MQRCLGRRISNARPIWNQSETGARVHQRRRLRFCLVDQEGKERLREMDRAGVICLQLLIEFRKSCGFGTGIVRWMDDTAINEQAIDIGVLGRDSV